MLKNIFKRFKNDESGAVTVDWVVLTAAIVGLGLVAYPLVSQGVSTKATAIKTSLGTTTTTTP
ncbi:MAG: pilus assembly protein [Rhodobacteraceae bacterium PARR1]|nr:MAG: pilus assembly protein [Rhodobacteraceae bacterium PARR1]OYU16990.1 MAG: pilus assembly protein [Rhodobacteraceae bacterium PARR1]